MKLNALDKKKMLDYIIEAINTSEITVYAVSKATNVRQTTIHPLKSISSFDNLLDEKMRIIIKEYSDEKFKEINNHLLFLLRKVSDLESLNKELLKDINKDQSNIS